MLNDLLANGYLDKKYYAKAGAEFVPPPDGALLKDAHGNNVEPPQFNFDSDAYREWRRQGQNMLGWLNTYAVTSFRAKFPALGAP